MVPPSPVLRGRLFDRAAIAHVYQAADLYLFPPPHSEGAIELPLSLTCWNIASALYLRRAYGVWIAYLPWITTQK